MKQIKKLFLMLLLVLGIGFQISNTITKVYAFEENDNFRYRVDFQLKVLRWDSETGDCEPILLEMGTDMLNNQSIWIARNDDRIFANGRYFPIRENLRNGEYIVPILTHQREWYYYVADYDIFARIENGYFTQVDDLNINYDVKNFNIEFAGYSGIYLNEKVTKSVEIEDSFYFKNLHKNIGNNINGSCAYVAMGTLLSYYDIFYNNEIVPNTYTRNGYSTKFIQSEYIYNTNILDCQESPGYTENFHQFLVNDIGRNGLNYGQSINYAQAYNILNYYLTNYSSLNQSDYNIRILANEQSIIDSLNKNQPVFLGFSSWATQIEVDENWNIVTPDYLREMAINNGHAVVAYGYEKTESGKIFYKCHSGWLNEDYHSEMMYYPYDNSAIAIALDVNKNEYNCSSAYVYKNQETNEEIAICPKCNEYAKDNIHIYCTSENFEHTINLDDKKAITYEFDVQCLSRYDITIETNHSINMMLYNGNKLVQSGSYIKLSSDQYEYFIEKDLPKGNYYLKVQYPNNETSGTIHTIIKSKGQVIESISGKREIDVLEHLHNHQNVFEFSTSKPELYSLELVGIKNGMVIYPEHAISITSTQGKIKNKFAGDTIKAITNNHANKIVFQADEKSIYQIHIQFTDVQVSSLKLYIKTIDDMEIKTLTSNDIYQETMNMELGDYARIVQIDRAGSYNFNIEKSNTEKDLDVIVLEKNPDGKFRLLSSYTLNSTQPSYNLYYNMNEDTPVKLAICYSDSTGEGELNIKIERELLGTFSLQLDGSSTIIQGDTRSVYLGKDAPDNISRLRYYWYSLDESVAKVSPYGTITAVGVGKTTIQAISKYDLTRLGSIEINVVEDPNQKIVYLKYGMDVREGGTISGTEVTDMGATTIPVSLNPKVTIHTGYTRLICLGSDSPSPSIQDFEWEVIQETGQTGMVSVSSFGTITGVKSGKVTIVGTYKYNQRYKVKIEIEVL